MTGSNFIFVVPKNFESVKTHFHWPEVNNIVFDYILDNESIYSSKSAKNLLLYSYYTCQCLNQRVEKYGAKKVFAINLIDFVPFAPFIFRRKIRISGIIYGIYLYNWKKSKWFTKLFNILKYQTISRCVVFSQIFILNDAASARHFNTLYKTNKFAALPDPFIPLKTNTTFDFRKEHNISQNKIVFAHFGSLSERKGTLLILDSINLLSPEQKNKFVFAFAGKINSDIKNRFYQKYEQLKENATLFLKDDFCTYEYLASLSQACDAILIPYQSIERSSGIVGYASQFKKPLIAPADGLLGKIVRTYNLGITLRKLTPSLLVEAYVIISHNKKIGATSKYLIENNVQNFQKAIECNLIN